jgi:DnaJ-domain-containing protein 1
VIYLFLLGGGLCLLIWVGRLRASRSDRQRLMRGFVAALAAVAAVVAGLRGAWIASAGLILLSAVVGGSVRIRRGPPSDTLSMNTAQARSILGVGPTADRAEIEQAYRRLIRRVHPDAGGAPGLAAQLNAARDVLLK